MMRSLLTALALGPLLLLTQGCNTYTYINVDLKLGAGFNTVTKGPIQTCHVFVTGAETNDFNLDPAKCMGANIDPVTLIVDKIQYSTFADSGNITFTLKLFSKLGEMPGCQLGEASTNPPIAIVSGKTLSASISVPYTAPTNCPP